MWEKKPLMLPGDQGIFDESLATDLNKPLADKVKWVRQHRRTVDSSVKLTKKKNKQLGNTDKLTTYFRRVGRPKKKNKQKHAAGPAPRKWRTQLMYQFFGILPRMFNQCRRHRVERQDGVSPAAANAHPDHPG